MRVIYFDTSALVKRYAKEKGSPVVNDLLSTGELITTSILTYPEIKAAFAKKLRLREMTERSYRNSVKNFQSDWGIPIFSIIGFTSEIAYLAGVLVEKNVLRAVDGVHLASAIIAKEHFGLSFVFVSSDGQLNKAAVAKGLDVINPENI
ncbi:MAG TPA: type II toxin-antitoxin system VapC family toxin [Thermodesulfobacteriota bacterium]|nr:type II toxin-antitoxin system VapC family toxin [Thermodesulfobacteriota bacterium]